MIKTIATYSALEKILVGVLLLLCAYFGATFLWLVLGNFWPGPLFDYWVDLPLIEKSFETSPGFLELATAHNNAHRILIPRLLFILDHHYFAGTNVLLITVSLLCKLFTLLLVNHLLENQPWRTRLVLNALAFAAILNAGNVYNVLFNFDLQWDLVSVFACYAIFCYTQAFDNTRAFSYRLAAYAFIVLAFFSHAGALSLPLVFLIIGFFHQRKSEHFLNIVLIVLVFYVNAILPIADPSDPDTQSAFTNLIVHPQLVALFVLKFISGSLAFHMGKAGYYFCFYILALLLAGSFLSVRNRRDPHYACRNIFWYFSIFLFLMIISIAAARSIFNPDVWAASRFQTTVLLFILCLHIHIWLCINQHFRDGTGIFLHSAITLHGLATFLLIHYFTYNVPVKLSNVVFFSQAYMLTHERNHHNAPRLLLWIHDKDVIADSDPFFRKYGLAWYADKQVKKDTGRAFIDSGKPLLAADNIKEFSNHCVGELHSFSYTQTQEGGIEFSAPVHSPLTRKTWYAIDADGFVRGFAYLFTSETGWLKHHTLKGYSTSESIAYIAEIHNNQPVCLYNVK